MSKYYLIADIGGTNINFEVIAKDKKKVKSVLKKSFLTYDYKNIIDAINDILDNQKIKVESAVFGVAGKVDNNIIHLSNSDIIINKKNIIKNTSLSSVEFINDLAATSWAVLHLKSNQLKTINKGKSYKNKTVGVVGAGTGLGKSVLIYDEKNYEYIIEQSEGGHEDFPESSEEEFKLFKFIQKKYDKDNVRYEDVLSGKGIENIYEFLSGDKKKASSISEIKKTDKNAKKTFELFYRFYARCAKNMALEHLAVGGIYLIGGIISKNLVFSKSKFMKEFTKHDKFKDMLKDIPIYAVKDYDVNLIGLKEYVRGL